MISSQEHVPTGFNDGSPVAGSRHETDANPQWKLPHQVGNEGDAAGHDRYEDNSIGFTVLSQVGDDVAADLCDSFGNGRSINQDAFKILVHACSVESVASGSDPGVPQPGKPQEHAECHGIGDHDQHNARTLCGVCSNPPQYERDSRSSQ